MTEICFEGTYFGAQHILDPANNSSWAGHTVAAMLAIWDYPKSWAHLATLPFPKTGGVRRRPKDMFDAYDLIPILWHTRTKSGMCLIGPNHECAHFWPFLAICHIFCPPCTMFSPPVHARRIDQWIIYDMGVMYIGPHGSHTTWAKRSNLR